MNHPQEDRAERANAYSPAMEGDSLVRIRKANFNRANYRFAKARILYLRVLDSNPDTDIRLTCLSELSLSYLLSCEFQLCLHTDEIIVKELLPGKEQARRRPEKVAEACRSLGDRSSLLENSLSRLLSLNFELRTYEAAESWAEMLVLCLEELYGPGSQRLATALSILATTKYLLRKYGEARSVFNEGLVIMTELDIDPSSSKVMGFLRGLGASLCAQGKRKHGRLYCRLASVSCISHQGKTSSRQSMDELLDMAMVFCERDDFSAASSICNTAIEDYSHRGARDTPSTLMSVADMLDSLSIAHGVPEIRARVEYILLNT
ncbi:MAG: hypothetical protein IPM23_16160 [Candidatus Melainabacteria bacterium]|nr:hypothetical protein [Candidatus Melainabacteria bacterium]